MHRFHRSATASGDAERPVEFDHRSSRQFDERREP
jgi:hypothetical protein